VLKKRTYGEFEIPSSNSRSSERLGNLELEYEHSNALKDIGGGFSGNPNHERMKLMEEYEEIIKFSDKGCPKIDDSGVMRYLRRVIGSLLNQMEVKVSLYSDIQKLRCDCDDTLYNF